MKLLLTSAGIKNTSIHDALVDLLGKPIAESSALCIPTATYAMPGGAAMAYRLIRGVASTPLCEVGWKSLGVLELTALPSLKEEHWVPLVQEADALLVGGGNPLYLCYWMRQSGLADLLPEPARETVYVGVSAGSMVMTPNLGDDFAGPNPPTGSDRALGLVDFSLFPHLDHPDMPDNSLANAEIWAAGIPVPVETVCALAQSVRKSLYRWFVDSGFRCKRHIVTPCGIVKTYPYSGNLGQLMPHKCSGELYFTDRFES